MNYGEKSCKQFGNCGISGLGPCNTACVLYSWNGKNPDTKMVKAVMGNHTTMGYPTRKGFKTLNGLARLDIEG